MCSKLKDKTLQLISHKLRKDIVFPQKNHNSSKISSSFSVSWPSHHNDITLCPAMANQESTSPAGSSKEKDHITYPHPVLPFYYLIFSLYVWFISLDSLVFILGL